MQEELVQREVADLFATGGSRPREKKKPFHVDVLDTTELENRAGLFASAGSIISPNSGWEQPPVKAIAFWVSTSATRKTKRNGISHKLEVDNASHVLFTPEVEDKFVSLAVKEYDHDDANTYLTVFASTRTQLLRWNLCLGNIDTMFRTNKWRDLPSPQILAYDEKYVDVGCGYVSEVNLGNCSMPSFSREDIEPEELKSMAWSRTDNSWIMSLTLEGSDLVLRDARLSIIWRKFQFSSNEANDMVDHSLGDYGSATGKGPPSLSKLSTLSTTARDVTCFKFLSGCLVLVAFGDGSLVLWDITPCIHVYIENDDNDGDEIKASLPKSLDSPPVRVLTAQVDYPVCQVMYAVLDYNNGHSNNHGSHLPLILASRDGRVRHVVISYPPGEHVNGDGESPSDCIDVNPPVVMERYIIDLCKETRYLDAGAGLGGSAVLETGGGAGVPGEVSHRIKSNASQLPLGLCLVHPQTKDHERIVDPMVCVVTSSGVSHLSFPSLALLDHLTLSDLTGLSTSAVVTNCITGAAVCESALVMVPAFDREARVLCRRLASVSDEGSDTFAKSGPAAHWVECPSSTPLRPLSDKLASREQERKEQRKIIDEQRAAGVVVVAAGARNTERKESSQVSVGAIAGDAHQAIQCEEGEKREVLSLFLSQKDMFSLGRAPNEGQDDEEEEDDDDEEEEEENGEDGQSQGLAARRMKEQTKAKARRSPLLSTLLPPPTPVTHRGAGANAANASKGRAAYSSASVSTGGGASSKVKKAAGAGNSLDKPVTFHAKIKSSGYGQTPNTALGILEKKRKERMRLAAKERDAARSRSGSAPAPHSLGMGGLDMPPPQLRRYPTECPAMHVHQQHHDFAFAGSASDRGGGSTNGGTSASEKTGNTGCTALTRIFYNSDGSLMGVASVDSAVSVLKLPISRYQGEGSYYVSHNRAVTRVNFSHNVKSTTSRGVSGSSGAKHLVLSSSEDGTARMWRGSKVDGSIIEFSHERCSSSSSILHSRSSRVSNGIGNTANNNVAIAAETTTNRRNRPYVGPVIDASFYYNDKFVVLGNTNAVYLYNYQCESIHAGNDLKRLRSGGSYKMAHNWRLPCRNVTAVECVNGILSPIIFAATSSRSLHVLDVVTGSICRNIENSHGRPIHSVALPQPSVYAQLDQSTYNIFATAATDNCVNIWDLRAPSVSCRYTGHTNRRETVQIALSPCLRFMICGSEDKSAILVDLRTGNDLVKYTGYRDVVSGVAFHPLSPQVATATYDGSLKFYCSP